MSTRREFLQKVSLLTVGGLLGGKGIAGAMNYLSNGEAVVPPASKELGLQIYSLQRELYTNTPQVMRELREAGYVNLELAGFSKGKIGGVDMMEFKKMAEDAGLKIVSSHVNPELEGLGRGFATYTRAMLPAAREYWKVTAADHAKLGCKYLIQPMMPAVTTHEDAALMCEFFNDAGKICKDAGLIFGYHNHDFEFKRIAKPDAPAGNPFRPSGDYIMDLFIEGTDPASVMFELDVYWTVRGGNDPLEYMKKYADRIKVLHIKDTAVLGESGLLNFENIYNQMYANGINDWYVELEGIRASGSTQLQGVKDCAAYLQRMPFVK
ncbi:MAG: sugar phosphate isomerase/epimerase [Alistipes sp.]|jgi:sugar phosphate isomerase/epimerase|nr:sugar phosphate isomerase/epimerase [Alistipes sp.]